MYIKRTLTNTLALLLILPTGLYPMQEQQEGSLTRPTKLDLFAPNKAKKEQKEINSKEQNLWRKQINNTDLLTALQKFLPADVQKEITSKVNSQLPLFNKLALKAYHYDKTPKLTLTKETLCHNDPTDAITINNNIAYLGCKNGKILFFDLTLYKVVHEIDAHKQSVTAIACDDTILVSGSSDNTIKIWDIKNKTLVATLNSHASQILALALDKKHIVSRCANELFVWDRSTYKQLRNVNTVLTPKSIPGIVILDDCIIEHNLSDHHAIIVYQINDPRFTNYLLPFAIATISSQGIFTGMSIIEKKSQNDSHTKIYKFNMSKNELKKTPVTSEKYDLPISMFYYLIRSQSIGIMLTNTLGFSALAALSNKIGHHMGSSRFIIAGALLYTATKYFRQATNPVINYILDSCYLTLPCINYGKLPIVTFNMHNAKYLYLWDTLGNTSISRKINTTQKVLGFDSYVVLVNENSFEILDFSAFNKTLNHLNNNLTVAQWELLSKINTAYGKKTKTTITEAEANTLNEIEIQLKKELGIEVGTELIKIVKSYCE